MNRTGKRITISASLNTVTDADVLEWWNGQSNKSAAIRELVRKAQSTQSIVQELSAIRKAIESIPSLPTEKRKPEKKEKQEVKIEDQETIANIASFFKPQEAL